MSAGLRAAAANLAPAWRRAWWILVPCCVAWGVSASPFGGVPWFCLAMMLTLVASTLLYRAALRIGGPLALGVGRLLATWLLTAAFFGVLALLLFVVLLCASYAVASAGAGFVPSDVKTWAAAVDERGRVVLAVVGLVGVASLFWALTRVALGPAATVARGRVQALSAWPLTRGLGLRLLATRALVALPAAIALAFAWRIGTCTATRAGAGAWVVATIAGLAVGALWLPLNTGLMTYIYERSAANRSDPTA